MRRGYHVYSVYRNRFSRRWIKTKGTRNRQLILARKLAYKNKHAARVYWEAEQFRRVVLKEQEEYRQSATV